MAKLSNLRGLNILEILKKVTGGSVGAAGGGNDKVFYLNDQTVTEDYTIPDKKNAMSAGSITVDDNVTVTIPDGSSWVIV